MTFTETTTDLPGPGAASELIVVRNDDGTTSLNWQNNSNTATRIVIQRQLSDGGWETIGEVDPGATSFTTSLQGNNFRIATEGRYGENSYSEGNNPASSTRYAVIDLGVNRYPIRVTNSGYVLCQGIPPKRWYQGQFQDLIGGDDPFVIGTADINEQGVVVGAVLLHHPGTPTPTIGTATYYVDSPGAWYRDANSGTRAAAKWDAPQPGPSPTTATQVSATLLAAAQSFPFSIIDYTNPYGPPYSGTVALGTLMRLVMDQERKSFCLNSH